MNQVQEEIINFQPSSLLQLIPEVKVENHEVIVNYLKANIRPATKPDGFEEIGLTVQNQLVPMVTHQARMNSAQDLHRILHNFNPIIEVESQLGLEMDRHLVESLISTIKIFTQDEAHERALNSYKFFRRSIFNLKNWFRTKILSKRKLKAHYRFSEKDFTAHLLTHINMLHAKNRMHNASWILLSREDGMSLMNSSPMFTTKTFGAPREFIVEEFGEMGGCKIFTSSLMNRGEYVIGVKPEEMSQGFKFFNYESKILTKEETPKVQKTLSTRCNVKFVGEQSDISNYYTYNNFKFTD